MSQVLNGQSIMVAVGILQPAKAVEVVGFLQTVLPDGGDMPSPADVLSFLKERERHGLLVRVSRSADAGDTYSLTLAGHRYLSPRQRRVRDKFRFYLLRDARRRKFKRSVDEAQGLVGDAPTVGIRALEKGSVANKTGQRVPSGRSYWPRVQKQFDITGLSASSADTFPNLLPFANSRQAEIAAGVKEGAFEFGFEGLAVFLGVSPRVISQILRNPDRHYRSFSISKRSGGDRPIESPRVFLKAIQWVMSDYIFTHLPIHPSCHSFQIGKSVVTNADGHVGRDYVANIDISDYFGSIKFENVVDLFRSVGFKKPESWILARLSCRNGSLPQGAPTSPVISNSFLYGFDDQLSAHCEREKLFYSRYADDITVSGSDLHSIRRALILAEDILRRQYGLSLNEAKTRISTRHGQQRVTGVIVNKLALPPRSDRRRVRAMIHNALKAGNITPRHYAEIRGHVSYFGMFPSLRGSAELEFYRHCLDDLAALLNNAAT